MGASRESREIEKVYERFLRLTRSFDKVLWLYCGKNIEREEYPMSSFSWIEEEFEDLEFAFKSMKDAMDKERMKCFKIVDDRRRVEQEEEEIDDLLDDLDGSVSVAPKKKIWKNPLKFDDEDEFD